MLHRNHEILHGGGMQHAAMSATHRASALGRRRPSNAGTGGSPLGIGCGAGHGAATLSGAPPWRVVSVTVRAGARGWVREEPLLPLLTAPPGRDSAVRAGSCDHPSRLGVRASPWREISAR